MAALDAGFGYSEKTCALCFVSDSQTPHSTGQGSEQPVVGNQLGTISVVREPPTGTPAPRLAFGYLAMASMFLGFFAWYRGLAIGPMSQVSQVQLNPATQNSRKRCAARTPAPHGELHTTGAAQQ